MWAAAARSPGGIDSGAATAGARAASGVGRRVDLDSRASSHTTRQLVIEPLEVLLPVPPFLLIHHLAMPALDAALRRPSSQGEGWEPRGSIVVIVQ